MPQFIQRPKRLTRGYTDPETLHALLSTLGTEQALILPTSAGDTWHLVYNRYRSIVSSSSPELQFHGRRGLRGELVAWVTKRRDL